jgi:glycosyltransferase involved in cell wall biosynthesis
MKIGIACATLGVVDRGGEIQLAELGRRLAGAGHEVTLWAGGAREAGSARVEVRGTLRGVPAWLIGSPRRTVRRAGVALSMIDRFQFAARAYGAMLRRPVDVVVPVDPPLHERLAMPLRARGARVMSFGLGGPEDDRLRLEAAPDLFIVSSPRAQQEARPPRRTRVEVVPPGVDLSRFRPDGALADLALPRPVVGVFGALLACKRVELAIAAVASMREGSLLVVGDGPERERIARAGAALGARFHMTGALGADEVPAWMRAIDVLCFPANADETFGMVVIEALACGRPVVASDDPVRRWILDGVGTVCDPTDPIALSRALTRAAGDGCGVERRARAEAFSWDRAAARIDELLRQL